MISMLHVTLFVSTCISSIHAVSSNQSFVFVGSEVRMPCRTTSPHPVEWKYWAVRATSPKYVFANNQLSNGYNRPYGRHSVKSNASLGVFDLVIANIRTSDAGTYKCFDDIGNFDNINAIYEMTVIDSPPTCSSNVSLGEVLVENDCHIEPDHIELSCNVLFNGNVAPVLQWTHSTNGRGILDESTTLIRTFNSKNNSTTFLSFKSSMALNNTFFDCITIPATGNTIGCALSTIYANYFFNNERKNKVENCHESVKSEVHLSDVKCAASTSIRNCDYHWKSQNSSRSYAGSNSKIRLSELEPGTYQCFASCYIGRRNIQCPEYTDCLVLSADDSNTFRIFTPVLILNVVAIVAVASISVVCFVLKKNYSCSIFKRHATGETEVPLATAVQDVGPSDDSNIYLNDKTLVNCLDVGNGLAEYLMSKEMLTAEQFGRIDKESNWPTYQDQNRALLEIIFPLIRDNLKFIEALQATDQSHIVKYISRLNSEAEDRTFEDSNNRPMTNEEISYVERNLFALINSINSDDEFLNDLLQKHCITERHKDLIMEHRTKSLRNKQLLSIIRRRSFANFQQFKIALENTRQHDVLILLNVENDPTDRSNEGEVFLPMDNVASSSV